MKLSSSSSRSHARRSWLQFLLGLVCTCVIVASPLLPWWKITFYGDYRPWTVVVYPYGAYGELPVVGLPVSVLWFILFTAGLLVCATLSFLGGILKGNKGKVLLGVAGVAVLGIVYRFYLRILERCANAEEALLEPEGTFWIAMGWYKVETGFQLGYRIAIWAGALCIASAIFLFAYEMLRRKLLRKPSPEVGSIA